jgi:Calcineurin-like phosphoesterase
MMPITRRQALGELLAATALMAAGCGGRRARVATGSGSTLASTWADPSGTGGLTPGPGEALIARTELGPRRAQTKVIATLAHLTDAHVLDASSPARVTFLDRLGAPFESTFRPQEALTAQVLAGAARSIRALRPDAVIQGGDLIDNAQDNELEHALAVLRGGVVKPGSGSRGYFGVQSAADPDPFYYRPDLDAPRHRGLLQRAVRPFASLGLGSRWYPVLGDHDILVAGEIPPTPRTRALAVGDRGLWELPPGLTLPPGTSLTASASPDGPPRPALVSQFLAQALAGPTVRVPADPSRRQLETTEVVAALRAGSALASGPDRLDYGADVGASLRLIVLDLARRGGGSGGLVSPDQAAWLEGQLHAAGERWVIAVSHQPLAGAEGGERLLAVLDRHPRVLAAVAGHTHRNRIEARPTSAGGYWLIETASLIDYPQQARALRLVSTAGGGVAIQTWMLDHVVGGDLGTISRQLAYLDAQGGRPRSFPGGRLDRNVTLYRAPARGRDVHHP